jgi:PAS domain S-box-containing protein
MPEMDGYEVCRRLKTDEKSRHIPVIFISALDETPEKVKGFEVGGVDYITKPFEAAEVLARVKTHLGLRQLQEHMGELVRQRTEELSRVNISLKKEIEERTRVEETLKKVNRMLRMLSECNQAVVRAQDENALLHDVCRYIVEIGSYKMAWVGFSDQDKDKTVRPVACAGCEKGLIKEFQITWSDTDDDHNPTGMAIRTGKPSVCENMTMGHSFNPGFAKAVNHDYRSSIAVPLFAKGNAFGALTVYADKPGTFDSDEVKLLAELASDVSYGIEALRTHCERKKAEIALRESEEKYRLTFSSISDVVYTIDSDFKISSITPNIENKLGYKPEELINRPIHEFTFLTPESMEKAFSDTTQVLAGGLVPASVYEFIAKDGKRIFAEISGSPLMREGKIIGLTSVARDVTERRQAEEALRESEEKYRLTFSSISDVVYTIDTDLRISSMTPNVEMIFGYKAEELINRPFQEFTFLTPESIEKAASDIMRVFSGDHISASVYDFIAKDGTRIFAEISGSPLMREGKIIGLTSVARDITERMQMEKELRESEVRYRTFFENTGTAMLIIEEDMVVSLMNCEFAKLTGYAKNEIEGKKKWTEFVTEENLEIMKEYHQLRRVNPSDAPKSYESRIIDRGGNVKDIFVTITMIPGTHKSVASIIDITDLKRLETQIRQAQKMEAIGTLAGGIAHDFNNILGAIMGYTDLALSNREMDSQLRNYLERVYQAGERARDLVKQILTFSRQTEQERTPVQIAVIVKEVLKLMRSSLPTTIEIQQDIITPPGRDVVLADPTQIHQVLMNLCTNAAHAMRAKGGILGVSIWDIDADAAFVEQYPEMEPGPYIKLTVSDTGHGMDAAVKERIFEPYFTTKGVGEGTGLGLAVVQGIVKSRGGAIFVTSEPGKGSIFHIFLPRYEGESPSRVEEEEAPHAKDERILFVDDEKMLVDMGKDMMETLGYRVTAATNSIEALEIFRNAPEAFDLLFTDMTMPKMIGTELAKECMTIRPDIPVILGTGFSDMIDEKKAKELGIRAFVMKPYVITTIAKAIRTVLEEQE